MPFSIITIRSQDEDGDALFPSLDAVNISPALEADDSTPRRLTARALEIYDFDGGTNRIIGIEDLRFEVAITNSRVVVWCRKFDKGGGWRGMGLGGLAFAAAANTVSHARAASRRKGKCLVGHIRYPWLKKVGYLAKQGMFTSQQEIRLVIEDGTAGANGRGMALDLRLSSSESAREVAEDILRRATDFRLAHAPDLDPEKRQTLEDRRKSGIPRATETTKFSLVSLPAAWVVRSDTARYPDLPATASPATESSDEANVGTVDPVPEPVEVAASTPVVERDRPVERSSDADSSLADFCHRCGYRFDAPEAFCPDCGAERRSRSRPSTPTSDSDPPEAGTSDDDMASESVEAGDDLSLEPDRPADPLSMTETLEGEVPERSETEEEQTSEDRLAGQTTPVPRNDEINPSLEGSRSSGQESTNPCPACGRALPIEARFCSRCGGATAPPEMTPELDPDRTVRRPRRQ